jgi:hypothetical protein
LSQVYELLSTVARVKRRQQQWPDGLARLAEKRQRLGFKGTSCMPQTQGSEVDGLYASLDVKTRIVVQQRTSEIKTLLRQTAQDIIEIGQKMIE